MSVESAASMFANTILEYKRNRRPVESHLWWTNSAMPSYGTFPQHDPDTYDTVMTCNWEWTIKRLLLGKHIYKMLKKDCKQEQNQNYPQRVSGYTMAKLMDMKHAIHSKELHVLLHHRVTKVLYHLIKGICLMQSSSVPLWHWGGLLYGLQKYAQKIRQMLALVNETHKKQFLKMN